MQFERLNPENGLCRQSKACEDAEARINNLLLFFSSLPVCGGQHGLMLSEPSLFLELAQNSKKKANNDRNDCLFSWITVFKRSLYFFQSPQ